MIVKSWVRQQENCAYCDWKLDRGEVCWRDNETDIVGCSRRCCSDAVRLATQRHRQRQLVRGMSHLYAAVGE